MIKRFGYVFGIITTGLLAICGFFISIFVGLEIMFRLGDSYISDVPTTTLLLNTKILYLFGFIIITAGSGALVDTLIRGFSVYLVEENTKGKGEYKDE